MKSSAIAASTAGVCTIILIAGCGQTPPTPGTTALTARSASSSPVPPAPSAIKPLGWISPNATSSGPLVYVAAEYDDAILIYSENDGTLLGEITSGIGRPYGLWVDKNHNLYVANQGNNTVTAYVEGSTTPYQTWSQGLGYPEYVIVDGSGDLFVSNHNNGTVEEYRPGSSTPYAVLQTAGTEGDGMGFDTQGHLYVAYRNGNAKRHGYIEKFAPGTTQGRVLGMTLNEPQGLVVDRNGNISVVATGSADRIESFGPGKQRRFNVLHAPAGTTLTQIALTSDQTQLFASTFYDALSIGYPLPTSGTFMTLFAPPELIQGIALSNGQTF